MDDDVNRPSCTRVASRIRGLDGLRAVSILFVIVQHGFGTIPLPDGHVRNLIRQLFGNGNLGVMTFFVISGYLITYLIRKEWEQTGTICLKSFYARRTLRIFPALYVYLLVIVVLRTVEWIGTNWGDLILAGTFLTNYRHAFLPPVTNWDGFWFVGHFWTLSLEEQFYLFWPATILVVGLPLAPRVALFLVLASPAIRVLTYFAWPASRGQLGGMVHCASDPIMLGCLAALWEGRPFFEKILLKGSSWIWPTAAALFLLVGSPWLSTLFRGSYTMAVGWSLNAISITFVVLWILRHPTCVVGRLLDSRVLRHVGILSYSLYLWQQLVLSPTNRTWTGVFPMNFIACFVFAQISYWVIEQPFLRLRARLRQQALPASSAVVGSPLGTTGVSLS